MSGAAAADTVTKYVAFDPNVRLRSGSSINEQQPIHIINKMNTHTHTHTHIDMLFWNKGYTKIMESFGHEVTKFTKENIHFRNGFEINTLPFEQGALALVRIVILLCLSLSDQFQ